MPANKNALIRYKTIDNCLRNPYRRWTLEDLVEACSDSLYEMEGIRKGVSVRTVQSDIQMMRSDKLGYNAPIEVYEHKYYRYAEKDYSITNMPLSQNDFQIMQEAVDMLRQFQEFDHFVEMTDVVGRLQDKLAISAKARRPIIHFDSVPQLKGLRFLNQLYHYIANSQTIRIMYKSFRVAEAHEFILSPYLLKEFRNRWFVFGSMPGSMHIYNFPLDRIECIEPVQQPYWENPEFDSEHFFDDVIGVSKNIKDKPREIKFWADANQSNYIKTKPIHSSQNLVSQDPDDGSCVFTINVVVNYELYSVLMSYGPGIKVIYPNYVAAYMRDKLKKAAGMYVKRND